MAILNITYAGRSFDYGLVDDQLRDADVRRIAAEALASGLGGLRIDVRRHDLDHYVVDRFHGADGKLRLYLRPKVPFGAQSSAYGLRAAHAWFEAPWPAGPRALRGRS